MNVAVRYQSRGGHVKAMAEILAEGAEVEAISVDDPRAPITEYVDLLFIGGALYAFKLDPSMEEFIDSIPEGMVGKAICFGSSALTRRPVFLIQQRLKTRGIEIHPMALYQRGKPKPYLFEIGPKFAADEIEKLRKELIEGKDTEAPILKAIRAREEAKAKKRAERLAKKDPEAAARIAREAEEAAQKAVQEAANKAALEAEEAAREAEKAAAEAAKQAEAAAKKAELAKQEAERAAKRAEEMAAEQGDSQESEEAGE